MAARLKSSPCLKLLSDSRSAAGNLFGEEECKEADIKSAIFTQNYCFNFSCCSSGNAHRAVVRSFQVSDKNFAKSRLALKLWRRDCSLKAGRTSFLIISSRQLASASPGPSPPAGRLQKPIRIPIIIRRWIGETPWLYYASLLSPPTRPHQTAT